MPKICIRNNKSYSAENIRNTASEAPENFLEEQAVKYTRLGASVSWEGLEVAEGVELSLVIAHRDGTYSYYYEAE